jgi:hypothetical protein
LAAWASNQLVRAHPERVEPILRLGEGLRRAHRELDGGQLRELTPQQRSLVQALSAQGRRLAAEAGQPLNEAAVEEVEQTLYAALADPDAAQQWAGGRLTRALSASVDLAGTTSPLTRTPQRTQKVTRAKANAAERERPERIARARRQAASDAREAAAREGAAATARRTLDAAPRPSGSASARQRVVR